MSGEFLNIVSCWYGLWGIEIEKQPLHFGISHRHAGNWCLDLCWAKPVTRSRGQWSDMIGQFNINLGLIINLLVIFLRVSIKLVFRVMKLKYITLITHLICLFIAFKLKCYLYSYCYHYYYDLPFFCFKVTDVFFFL